MTTYNTAFSIATRTIAAINHPLIKRANLGFALVQPFSWSLINSASTFAQLSPEDRNSERGDALKIKMATLRHFNRMVADNDIGMGTINACLRPDEKEVHLDEIKALAQDRIKIERRSGKLKPADVEAACAKKRRIKGLMDEVFYLCNRSNEVLEVDNAASGFEAHICYDDKDLVDYDQYDYVLDSLLDKCTQPVIRATEELQRVMDRSYRLEIIQSGEALMAELTKLGTELGINWGKIKSENATIEAELLAAASEDNASDAHLDNVFAEADAELPVSEEPPAPHPTRTVIKSAERQAREAEEAKARQEQVEYAKKQAAKAAKAAATKAANKAKSLADLGQLIAQG